MTSSIFSRRPRIQPLPPVCKKAPETESCYERPTDPPEPLHAAGSLTITSLAGDALYYSTFRTSGFRTMEWRWTMATTDSQGNFTEPELDWWREANLGDFDVSFTIPIWVGHTFIWSNVPLTDEFPWYVLLKKTITTTNVQKCVVAFWN